jgi:glycosyltransferase involved in cell wall biosynthesis
VKAPRISVIVPIYNGEQHLSETLRSLLAQTHSNFELLAIDDGSSDGSAEVVRSMNDDRIRLVRQQNGGLCGALNRGIAEARAPFIARSDQDDLSIPERLERQLKAFEGSPDAIALFAYTTKFGLKHTWRNGDKVVMAPGQMKDFEPMEDGCLLGSTMFASTEVLRSTGGFRQQYYPCDDWDLELRLSQAGRVLVLREALVSYRFHAGANTYRAWPVLLERSRWAENSYLRRIEGRSEFTLEEFRESTRKDIWGRVRRYRKDLSKLHMRMAGQGFLDGAYAAGAWHLFVSSTLGPFQLMRRLRRYFGRA